MKKRSTSHTVTPEGWKPKPDKSSYNYFDWLIAYDTWCKYIHTAAYCQNFHGSNRNQPNSN